MTEDFCIYMWVGGTHFLANIQDESEVCEKGLLCPGFAIATAVAQAVIFTSVKMWELWQTVEAPVVIPGVIVNPVHGAQPVVTQAVVAAPAAAVIINPTHNKAALHNPSRADAVDLARKVLGMDERTIDNIIADWNGVQKALIERQSVRFCVPVTKWSTERRALEVDARI